MPGKLRNFVNQAAARAATGGLMSLLRADYDRVDGQNPVTSTGFRAAQGTLQDLMGQFQKQDASTAAARGLAGSSFENGQAAARGGFAADFTRGSLVDAQQRQDAMRTGALQRLLMGEGLRNQIEMQRAQQDAQRMNLLGSVVGGGVGLLVGGPPGAAIGAGMGQKAKTFSY